MASDVKMPVAPPRPISVAMLNRASTPEFVAAASSLRSALFT